MFLASDDVPLVPRIDIMQAALAAKSIVERTILKRSRRQVVTVSNERERQNASWLNKALRETKWLGAPRPGMRTRSVN